MCSDTGWFSLIPTATPACSGRASSTLWWEPRGATRSYSGNGCGAPAGSGT